MQPYTADDMLYVLKLELGIAESRAAKAALLKETAGTAERSRRSPRAWLNSVFAFVF